MAIRFHCPCGERLSAEPEDAGKTTHCTMCGAPVRIPGESESARPPTARELPIAQASRHRDRLEEQDSLHGRQRVDFEYEPDTSSAATASLVLGIAGFIFSILASLPAIIFGFVALSKIAKSKGGLTGRGLAVTGIVLGGISLLVSMAAISFLYLRWMSEREIANLKKSGSNMNQLVIAMYHYHNENGSMPAPAICDESGKPLLSWRVALLPYLGEGDLYKRFRLDEPWDSAHNKTLIWRMPKIYQLPTDKPDSEVTHYKLLVGPDSWFQLPQQHGFRLHKGPTLLEVTNAGMGAYNTILLVESEDPVVWTKPEDIAYDPNEPIPALGGMPGAKSASVATWDGWIHPIRKDCNRDLLRPGINRNSKEPIDFERLR